MFNDKDFDRAFNRTRRLAMFIFMMNVAVIIAMSTGIMWLIVALYELGPQGIGEFFGQIMNGFDAAQGGKS